MKSFLINRKVEREVVHLEYVSEPTEVHFDEITHQDLMNMKFDQVRSYASHLRMQMKNMTSDIGADREQPQTIVEDLKPMTIKHDPVMSSVTLSEPDVDDVDKSPSAQLGMKVGKSSKYHYVYQTQKSGKYHACIGQKVEDYIGTFESGEDAGLAVDAFLDKQNDFNRPRNRNKFPEIQKLYIAQMNKLKEAS